MGFLSTIGSLVGGALGGPVGAAAGGAIGGAVEGDDKGSAGSSSGSGGGIDFTKLATDVAGDFLSKSQDPGQTPQPASTGGSVGGTQLAPVQGFNIDAFLPQDMPAFAKGGTLRADQKFGLVGENGPEVIKNNEDGSTDVIPLDKGGGQQQDRSLDLLPKLTEVDLLDPNAKSISVSPKTKDTLDLANIDLGEALKGTARLVSFIADSRRAKFGQGPSALTRFLDHIDQTPGLSFQGKEAVKLENQKEMFKFQEANRHRNEPRPAPEPRLTIDQEVEKATRIHEGKAKIDQRFPKPSSAAKDTKDPDIRLRESATKDYNRIAADFKDKDNEVPSDLVRNKKLISRDEFIRTRVAEAKGEAITEVKIRRQVEDTRKLSRINPFDDNKRMADETLTLTGVEAQAFERAQLIISNPDSTPGDLETAQGILATLGKKYKGELKYND